jgi:transcriptional regulator with XRE-family HTH domain
MSGEANSKFTEPRVEAALNALRMGCTRQAAAGAAGVSRVTFWRWMDDETFRSEVEKAEAVAEATYTAIVANAAPKSWQAAAWWLERRQWREYGRHERVDVTFDAKAEARRLADELGLDVDSVMAEAEAVLREGRA